jgi:nucleoside-diphosphate-sugar epimerase
MLIHKFKNNEPFIEFSSGNQLRDFIYIDDVKSAFKLIIEAAENLPNFKEIEIGSGKPISIKAIVLLVKDLIKNKATELRFGQLEDRPGETLQPFADIQELKKLGWEPIFSIEEGLRKSINESVV